MNLSCRPRSDRELADLTPQLLRYFAQANPGEPQLAEDLAQETLLAALRAEDRAAQPILCVQRFVFGIAWRKQHGHLRRKYRERELARGLHRWHAQSDVGVRASRSRPWHDVTPPMIRKAIHRLPPQARAVVALRFLAGWDTQEVAEKLELRPCEVSRYLQRGLCKLRAELSAVAN